MKQEIRQLFEEIWDVASEAKGYANEETAGAYAEDIERKLNKIWRLINTKNEEEHKE